MGVGVIVGMGVLVAVGGATVGRACAAASGAQLTDAAEPSRASVRISRKRSCVSRVSVELPVARGITRRSGALPA
jgi:hypothetical protein